MLLKAYNKQLIEDREKTYLTAAAAAAATSLTVADTDLVPAATSSNTWADNDYVLVGNFGEETCEIMQMSAAVTSATALAVDRSGSAGGLRFSHPIGTPIYRLDFNRVEINRNTTDSTSGVTVLATIRLQTDDLYTRYEDTANTTGYGFVRFNNETSGTFSSYSDGVNYEVTGNSSSRDPRTLWSMRKKVRLLLDEKDDNKLTDTMIDEGLNDKQRDIGHQRLWSFYESERSFSIVANQFAYDIPATVHKPYSIRFDTQPLVPINKNRWDLLHFDTDTSTTDPSFVAIWNGQFLIGPRPSTASSTTTINDVAGISATATSVTVTLTSAFNRGDYFRFIIDSEVIYATNSTITTFTGLLRGREGTTAATHANAATITERDIVYNVQVEPTDLIDTQDRTAIPEPEVLVFGASADLALLLNKETLHDRLLLKYNAKMKELESKYSTKQSGTFGRVHDPKEVVGDGTQILHRNNFPFSIN